MTDAPGARSLPSVEFDAEEIRHHRRDGVQESIQWSDLHEVAVMTNDEGPFVDDVIWVLSDDSAKAGCAVPSTAPGMEALLIRLQKLPGFDNNALTHAMGSTEEARFLCWRRAPG